MNATIVDHVDVNPNNNNRTREVGLEPKRYGVNLTVDPDAQETEQDKCIYV